MGMKHCKEISVFCVLFIAFGADTLGLAVGESLTPEKKKNCTYVVTVETTCTNGADTSNHVSIRFGDTNSNDVVVQHLNTKHVTRLDPLKPAGLDDTPIKPFQACTVDEFQLTGQCVESPICYLYLKLIGTDDWRPGFAQIRVLEGDHLSSKYFYFRRYLPRHVWHGSDVCDREVTPFGIRHKRRVFGKKPDDEHLVMVP
ncbi:embryo-specific protein ATS3A-like [Vitis riparia]|uniref:embryo-specific protein ATS3A-like n=1 Tax=Vitis riparia TaxID=96939 RepID=UPI00155B1DA4|nr:embryo-specific protein ATS3A-like [Vitis riparia]